MKVDNEETKEKILAIIGQIKRLVIELGASEWFAQNAAAHIAEAIILTPKSYSIIKEQMKDEKKDDIDSAAFRFFLRALFAEKFNEAVLPERLKSSEPVVVKERKPSCYM